MLAKRASRARPRVENTSYWMSYSDMMAALLLMFVLLLFLSFTRYTQLQVTKEAELSAKEVQLLAQETQLTQAQEALITRENDLAAANAALNATRLRLDEQELEINAQASTNVSTMAELEQSLAKLILQQAQIDEQERLLSLSQEEIDAARAQLATQAQELTDREITLSAKDAELLLEKLRVDDLQALMNSQKEQLETQTMRIDELVGVRARIIEQLRDAFAKEGLAVKVDTNTGAITMDSTVFFDTDRATLKDDGRLLLTRLLPVYLRTLMSPENAEYVSEILVEGHTDSDGTYQHNLDLSQRRAFAVAYFATSEDFPGLSPEERTELRRIVKATGSSETQLIYDAYGVEDKAASRRVEIKFRLKDAEMIESLNRILTTIGN